MPNIYVRSTDGNNADDGSTWALAKLDLAGAAAIDAAGDTIFVSQNHAESTTASISLALAGTAANPTKVICGNDAAEPPTALATTGTVTTTGASSITISGHVYIQGLVFNVGTGSTSAALALANAGEYQTLENCAVRVVNTGAYSGRINIGGNASGGANLVRLLNTTVKFAAAGQGIAIGPGTLEWNGGGLEAGTTSPTTLFLPGGTNPRGNNIRVSGVDLSAGGSAMNIFTAGSVTMQGNGIIRNSKLPASWSGGLTTGTIYPGQRFEMHNCDSGDTNYRLWVEDYSGSIKTETTIVRTGGASDGTTTYSWKMATTANAEYPLIPLESPEFVVWNDTTGSSKTATVEFVHDSQGAGTGSAAQDDEIWLEVQYLGTSGYPLSSFVSDSKADVLATAADQTSSSETWTTTGLTTPVKQKMSVTFTPQEKGYIIAKVKLAKASKTYYVDPKITVT